MNIKSKNGSISISGTDVKVGNDLDLSFQDYVNTRGKLNYRIYEDYTQMIEGGL